MGTADKNLERCAILLLSLGEDAAADVFKYLSAREVQQIGTAMANLTQITRADVDNVLEDFRQEADQFMAITLGSDDYIRSVLTKALGTDRAAGLIEDILEAGNGASGIDALNWLDAASVTELIQDEHPQIIATIMVHLERDRASDVLALLNERIRNDVLLRIATFGGVQPAALQELTDVLTNVLSGQGTKRSKMGGVRTAAEIINYMSTSEEEAIVSALREMDADLTDRIVEEMFVFERTFYFDEPNVLFRYYETGTLTAPGNKLLNFLFPRLAKAHIKGGNLAGHTPWSNAAVINYIDVKLFWNPIRST